MNTKYRRYHPQWLRERMPIFWWLERWSYTRFITRELTSLAVGFAALALLLQIRALGRGPEAYARFQERLAQPAVIAVAAVVLFFLLVHTVTWLNLAPKAMEVSFAGRKVPRGAVLAAHYAAWVAATVLIVLALAGR